MFEEFLEYANKHLSAEENERADDLVVVLKAHLLIEEALNYLIDAYIFKYEDQKDLLDCFHLSFYEKIKLVEHRNLLNSKQIASIKKINEIRNKFAHKLGCCFSDIIPLLDAFFAPFESTIFKVIRAEHREDINKNYKIKFTLCVFNTLGTIMFRASKAGG